ncbi:MAG: hypothetical protein N2690_01260 [Rhodocyclaceae bacterium]|nr:hypothetical protein [Rhodocyclaceae bacterium]
MSTTTAQRLPSPLTLAFGQTTLSALAFMDFCALSKKTKAKKLDMRAPMI